MTRLCVVVNVVLMALTNNVSFRRRSGQTGHSSVALTHCNRFSGKDTNTGTSEYEITVRALRERIWFICKFFY